MSDLDTIPAPPDGSSQDTVALHSILVDVLAKLTNALERLEALEESVAKVRSEVKTLNAEVTQCINYIRGEALEKAAALRKRGQQPEAWQEEDTTKGSKRE